MSAANPIIGDREIDRQIVTLVGIIIERNRRQWDGYTYKKVIDRLIERHIDRSWIGDQIGALIDDRDVMIDRNLTDLQGRDIDSC